jgi:hypothetical protein
MKRRALILALVLLPVTGQAGPKYVNVDVSQLPSHISVETSRLRDNWFGFTVSVDLKRNSSSSDSWKAELVLKKEKGDYLLTAQIVPSPVFRDETGQFLSASRSHPAEAVQFWSTIDREIMKMAMIELRDNDNMIVYVIRLSSAPNVK